MQVPVGEEAYLEEGALIDLVAAGEWRDGGCLRHQGHWMDDILTRHGFRVAVMRADAVAPENREAWVAVERGGGENGWAGGLTGGAVRAGPELHEKHP